MLPGLLSMFFCLLIGLGLSQRYSLKCDSITKNGAEIAPFLLF